MPAKGSTKKKTTAKKTTKKATPAKKKAASKKPATAKASPKKKGVSPAQKAVAERVTKATKELLKSIDPVSLDKRIVDRYIDQGTLHWGDIESDLNKMKDCASQSEMRVIGLEDEVEH